MSVKRVASLGTKGAKNCLTCGRELENLQDNTINTCSYCKQGHFVDIEGTRIALIVVEKPDCRRRPQESIAKEEMLRQKVAKLEKMLEAAKTFGNERAAMLEKANERAAELESQLLEAKKDAREWEEAAEGLARQLEILKEQGAW